MFNRQIALAHAASGATPAVGAAVLLLFWPNAAGAAGRPDYGGKMSLTVVHQEAKPLNGKGRVALATVYKGTNASIGRVSWMDGGDVYLSGVADLTQGNGVEHGSGLDIKDGAVVKAYTYVNRIKTVVVDGKPMTTVDGHVAAIGAAPMKDIRVRCAFTSQTKLECEWTARAIRGARR